MAWRSRCPDRARCRRHVCRSVPPRRERPPWRLVRYEPATTTTPATAASTGWLDARGRAPGRRTERGMAPIGDRGAALASRGMKPPRGFLGARARMVELDGVSDTTEEDGISNTVHPLVPGGHPIRLVRPRLAASQESLPSSSCSDAGDRCAPPAQASAARHL